MKKYIALVLSILMLLLPACASNSGSDNTDADTNSSEQITEISLDKLLDSGWTQNEGTYEWSETSDYRKLDLAVSVEQNDLIIVIDNDYGDNNKSMEAAYKEDESLAAGMAARWFADVESITEETFDNMRYTVKVGGNVVASGGMTADAAQDNAAEYDD
ncbi:MAG: hypothetical protein KBS56_05070 [Clostridiales bacterium]|nr:hypothetical protein [Candidatus Crickella equi]